MAKMTIVEDKPVPPPKKYILEMTQEEAECLGEIMSFVSSSSGPTNSLHYAVRSIIPSGYPYVHIVMRDNCILPSPCK